MDPHTLIDDFSRKFSELAAKTPLADVEKNARALMTSLLSKAQLVTREEFDRQAQV
ncbi:MAG: accessory factor UbiK family protein, partial [Ferrovum sp.]|nr:accessory factor UbiK family protein [Ferrovum sp.]